MKKFLSALLIILLVAALCVPAFAETGTEVRCSRNSVTAKAMFSEDSIIGGIEHKNLFTPCNVVGGSGLSVVSDRTQYPYSAVAKIDAHYSCGCSACGTGFMVSANGLLTAGHVVACDKHPNSGADTLTFYFGFKNYNDYNYKYDKPVTYWFGPDKPKQHQNDWDYGYVKFQDRVGDITGWFGYGVVPDDELEDSIDFRIAGYVDYDMFTGTGKAKAYSEYILSLAIDAKAGMSGAPIFAPDGVAVGIYVSGNSQMNYARRITSSLLQAMRDAGVI